ncbi:MAG: class I SAM-dependent methyltransferase [Planctomycetota bacterium]|jgi:cyclopropane-fatty-acyl-phospholipid synthase
MTMVHDGFAATDAPAARRQNLSIRQRIAHRLVHSRLATLQAGVVEIVDAWDGSTARFGRGADGDLCARVRILDPAFYTAMAARGSIGVAEAWMDGHWTCDDLTALVRIMVLNRPLLEGMEHGGARVAQFFLKFLHGGNANTRSGSKRNIAAHYDLGNDFFELFLDPTLTYSCGIFEHEDATVEQAQVAKLDRLCRKLALRPDDHLLEIGTGWGSMALHAASQFGCRVTTTTISREQHAVAVDRVQRAGLADRVEVLCADYRDLNGRYDKLVNCEMIEAVGADYLPEFMHRCSELLEPDGVMVMQAILISDQHYQRALREVDFIKRYIFPGSFIPSTTAILSAATESSDLRLVHLEEIGPHYATTLRCWREALIANADRARTLGYDDRFLRMWEYYLCYCEGGFAERFLGAGQFVFAKPGRRAGLILTPRSSLPCAAH